MATITGYTKTQADATFLASANNLSDVASAATARTNIGAAPSSSDQGEFDPTTISASGSTTLTPEAAAYTVTMTANASFTFPTPTRNGYTFALLLSGAFTPTFPASVVWDSGTAPTYSTPSVYVFTTFDQGTTYYGSQAGKAFA